MGKGPLALSGEGDLQTGSWQAELRLISLLAFFTSLHLGTSFLLLGAATKAPECT